MEEVLEWMWTVHSTLHPAEPRPAAPRLTTESLANGVAEWRLHLEGKKPREVAGGTAKSLSSGAVASGGSGAIAASSGSGNGAVAPGEVAASKKRKAASEGNGSRRKKGA